MKRQEMRPIFDAREEGKGDASTRAGVSHRPTQAATPPVTDGPLVPDRTGSGAAEGERTPETKLERRS